MLFALGALALAAAPAPRWAVAVLPSGREFSLEIAADDDARARGYMFRETVGPKEGMLFVFDTDDRHSFWMKNCRVALDIIWLDAAFRVVHVAPEQAPCPDGGPCPSVVPPRPARYVIELAGGTSRAEGLGVGDTIVVLSERPLR